MARKKSKAKKRGETMRQRQMRLRRMQQAMKQSNRQLPPGQRGGALTKTKTSTPTTRGGNVQRSGNNVLKVKVKDLGTTQRPLSGTKPAGALKSTAGKVGTRMTAAFLNPKVQQMYRNYNPPKLGSRPTSPNRSQRRSGNTNTGPKQVKYPTAAETQAAAANRPKQVKYPTAAETRAAEARRKAAEAERRRNAEKTDKPKITAPPTKQKQTGDRAKDMATWANANRKMIEKVGTKAQRAILARVDAQKKKKKPNMSGNTLSNKNTA
jgi:hypothetical protein